MPRCRGLLLRQPMRKWIVAPVVAALAALSCHGAWGQAHPAAAPRADAAPDLNAAGIGWGWGPDRPGGYASNQIIVRVKPGVQPVQRDRGWSLALTGQQQANQPEGKAAAEDVAAQQALAAALSRWQAQSIAPTFTTRPADRVMAQQLAMDRYFTITVPAGTDTPRMIAELANSTLLETAELDGVGGIASLTPNDVNFTTQWNMQNTGQEGGTPDADIDAPEAWELYRGSGVTIVAVIDTGVQTDHPELIGRVISGISTHPNGSGVYDMHGHGTHCAGNVAATGNNWIGIAGMNWNTRILAMRCVDPISGAGNESHLANAILYATDNGAHILSMSLQYYVGTSALNTAVAYAYDHGVLPIAASGNFQTPGVIAYPARFDKCMAIGATNRFDQKWSGSNTGPELDVTAPGQEVYSLWIGSGYNIVDGTSMATPHVAGLATLVRSYNPSLTIAQIEQILKNTAEDRGAPGWDSQFGWGRVNAFAALLAAQPSCPGDANHDGITNFDDVLFQLTNWGPCPTPATLGGCPADVSPIGGDGIVNFDDVLRVIQTWGACP